MRHVFVETNWVVDFAAPEHRQAPGARSLFDRARRRELMLHLPNLCLGEARRVLLTKFQPRGEADAIRHYVRWAAGVGSLSDGDRSVVIRVVEEFESKVRGELENLDSTFNSLRAESGIEIFPMNDRQLALSIEISPYVDLHPFDECVLAAVLGRADELHAVDADVELAFCELDGHLQPWDKTRQRRDDLCDLYDRRGIWVYGDFYMQEPVRPPNWPMIPARWSTPDR